MMKHCPKELYIEKNSSFKNFVLYVIHEDSIPPTPSFRILAVYNTLFLSDQF